MDTRSSDSGDGSNSCACVEEAAVAERRRAARLTEGTGRDSAQSGAEEDEPGVPKDVVAVESGGVWSITGSAKEESPL